MRRQTSLGRVAGFILFLIQLIAMAHVAVADNYQWTSNGPVGGLVRAFASESAEGTVSYAGGVGGGMEDH